MRKIKYHYENVPKKGSPMKRRRILNNIIIFLSFTFLLLQQTGQAQPNRKFWDYCMDTLLDTGKCPENLCRMDCLNKLDPQSEQCDKICVPRRCPNIPIDQCPLEFCAVMVNCSHEKICHFKMAGGQADCGDTAYAGQDVACCPGLVRRCGIEFIDGTCDMEAKQDPMYSLPICIPCGNGICENFENRCNCPEDCGRPPEHGGTMRDQEIIYIRVPKDPQKSQEK